MLNYKIVDIKLLQVYRKSHIKVLVNNIFETRIHVNCFFNLKKKTK